MSILREWLGQYMYNVDLIRDIILVVKNFVRHVGFIAHFIASRSSCVRQVGGAEKLRQYGCTRRVALCLRTHVADCAKLTLKTCFPLFQAFDLKLGANVNVPTNNG